MKKILLILLLCNLFFVSISNAANDEKPKDIYDYERLARSGDPMYQYKYGFILEFGIRTNKDIYTAINYYKKASDKGIERASTRLGVIYFEEENYEKMDFYLKRAMAKREPLSFVYYGKYKLKMNEIDEAEKYFKEAMSMDNSQSYYEYGILEGEYRDNYYLGYVNTTIAQIRGYKSKTNYNSIYKGKLSINQIYSANDRVKRYQSKYREGKK